ncbi:DUF4974 domain-containing protein [Pedobacter hiemivivus]|uniref:DUF4974 domain-containing protein n=1 Tax=Pedobacter hiemivivus TaxID=2530454 RepID=A0A4U1GMW0_9SPHI|nr:FecR family protein [Pedobacter hiemivivus]TKC65658.1 DUF4974 domain-containing protein [Pedobacter hiemivivus]
MDTSRAKTLYHKFLNGTATEAEKAIVESWYLHMASNTAGPKHDRDYEAIRLRILTKVRVQSPVNKLVKFWKPFLTSAAVLMVAFIGYLLFNDKTKDAQQLVSEIHPGRKVATLTLANGRKIALNDAIKGEVAIESGVSITKDSGGRLVYTITEQHTSEDNLNTLSTARGETFQVRLPDGSGVWLNAASSLTYSSSLTDKFGKRSVKLTGEGYFEISKDKKHPFVVESQGNRIEVLGTHFNVNAYHDEPAMKTTLLEGSVIINDRTTLRPDEQAIITNGEIKVIPVIAETYTDWKGDAFNFRKEELESIMRKVSRWYDVTVEYKGVVDRGETFTGYISRDADVSKVLQTLSKISKLKFHLDKKKIIVSK